MTPGLTGWAQINGRDELEIPDKARLDGEYVKHLGPWMDLKCFLGTIGSVLMHDGVVEGGTGELNKEEEETEAHKSETAQSSAKKKTIAKDIEEREKGRRKKKILITGSGSYVGTSVEAWLRRWPEYYQVDTLDMRTQTWRTHDFSAYDVVYHVAGLAHQKETKANKDLYQKVFPSNDYIESGKIEKIHMDTGKVDVKIQIRDSYYYDILSDLTGLPIKSEYHLIRLMKELSAKKKEFEEVSQALKDARERGYGVMKPVLSEITLSEPEVVKHGNKYGVKIRAEAPSIHLIRANLTTEVAPIVGTQLQAEDLITYIKEQAGEEPREIWNVNIFGKTLEQLVDDGISGKVTKINDDSQEKLQNAMEKIVNESSGGLICIII